MSDLHIPSYGDRRGGPPWPPTGHIHPDTGQARRPVPTKDDHGGPDNPEEGLYGYKAIAPAHAE